jgi:glutamate formiminotransferase / formiminotetrahydrofolate cyclodeaminase
MQGKQLIECVPNFSEGRDLTIIKQITDAIEAVDGVKLLDVDPGKATNRTVVTFVGEPEPVIAAAFHAIKKAAELIDMSKHTGAHPRMGATDVCPLIPIANITMEEVVKYAHKLAEKVGQELDIPLYLYEYAATSPERKNLATVRSGEYEGLPEKLKNPKWKPDYGPSRFNAKAGATAISARDFLIAYNVNLNTTSVRRANSVAFDVREKGRVKRKGDQVTGEIVRDAQGEPIREPGTCKAVKAIGWYIDEYGIAQISMNITDINKTPLHIAFEACRDSANGRGLRVTGSELVGLVPKKVLIEAGKYFLRKQHLSVGVSERDLVNIAVESLGLAHLGPFDPDKKVIEYLLEDAADYPLVNLTAKGFADQTASGTPTPGGGSVAALVGALGASLGTMVANLSSHKRGWDDKWEFFSEWAEKGQALKDKLLHLVDEDTKAFNAILEAVRMPKSSDEEKAERKKAMHQATKYAIEIPFQVLKTCYDIFPLSEEMVKKGNPNSVSDAGVAALCARAAMHGAWMNVKINAAGFDEKAYVDKVRDESAQLCERADQWEQAIRDMVDETIKN